MEARDNVARVRRLSSPKATVLVVDGDPATRRLQTEVLEQEGYRALAAGDRHTALEQVKEQSPDLVLLDIAMPDCDGHELCRHTTEFYQIPVIVVTEKADVSDKARAFREGADDYVTKPFSNKVLAARVKAILRRTLL